MTDFFENLLSNGELQEKVAELQAYKDVNEDFKTAWEELKAENNQLKEDIQDIAKLLDIDVDDELNYGFIEFEVKELKAENERLKKDKIGLHSEIKQLEQEIEYLKPFERQPNLYKAKYKIAESNNENLIAKCEHYSDILQEIKAIAEARCNECKYGKDGISCEYGDCGEAKLHLITQLITKAEEE